MSSNPPFLPVSTASVGWSDSSGNVHLHVYACDGYTVTERQIGNGATGWSDGTFNQQASAISAAAWQDANGAHIRVYCTNDDATVEWCCDNADSGSANSWYQGQYTTS